MKKFIIIAAVVLSIGLLIVWNFFSLQSDKVGLQDDGVYFGMNQFELFMKKGEDYKTTSDPQENTTIFTFDEIIGKKNAEVSYEFTVGGSYSLKTVTAVIESADRQLYDELCEKLTAVYSEKKDFSDLNESQTPPAVFTLVTKPDSPQHKVTAEFSDGKITVVLTRNYEYTILERFFSFMG